MILNLSETLSKINFTKLENISILLRHAERTDIKDGDTGLLVDITEQGIVKSIELGNEISKYFEINKIYSSPLLRCINTAININKGNSKEQKEIIKTTILGEPGLYVNDRYIAGLEFKKRGTYNLVRDYINGAVILGMNNLNDANKSFYNKIFQLSQNNKYNLFVSHDAIIIPLIKYLLNYDFNEYWLNYLSGIVICGYRNETINYFFN